MKKLTLAILVLACPLFSIASTYKSGRLSSNYYHITCSDNVKTICWGTSIRKSESEFSCLWKCNKIKGPDDNGSFSVPSDHCRQWPSTSFIDLEVAKRDLGDKVCSML